MISNALKDTSLFGSPYKYGGLAGKRRKVEQEGQNQRKEEGLGSAELRSIFLGSQKDMDPI